MNINNYEEKNMNSSGEKKINIKIGDLASHNSGNFDEEKKMSVHKNLIVNMSNISKEIQEDECKIEELDSVVINDIDMINSLQNENIIGMDKKYDMRKEKDMCLINDKYSYSFDKDEKKNNIDNIHNIHNMSNNNHIMTPNVYKQNMKNMVSNSTHIDSTEIFSSKIIKEEEHNHDNNECDKNVHILKYPEHNKTKEVDNNLSIQYLNSCNISNNINNSELHLSSIFDKERDEMNYINANCQDKSDHMDDMKLEKSIINKDNSNDSYDSYDSCDSYNNNIFSEQNGILHNNGNDIEYPKNFDEYNKKENIIEIERNEEKSNKYKDNLILFNELLKYKDELNYLNEQKVNEEIEKINNCFLNDKMEYNIGNKKEHKNYLDKKNDKDLNTKNIMTYDLWNNDKDINTSHSSYNKSNNMSSSVIYKSNIQDDISKKEKKQYFDVKRLKKDKYDDNIIYNVNMDHLNKDAYMDKKNKSEEEKIFHVEDMKQQSDLYIPIEHNETKNVEMKIHIDFKNIYFVKYKYIKCLVMNNSGTIVHSFIFHKNLIDLDKENNILKILNKENTKNRKSNNDINRLVEELKSIIFTDVSFELSFEAKIDKGREIICPSKFYRLSFYGMEEKNKKEEQKNNDVSSKNEKNIKYEKDKKLNKNIYNNEENCKINYKKKYNYMKKKNNVSNNNDNSKEKDKIEKKGKLYYIGFTILHLNYLYQLQKEGYVHLNISDKKNEDFNFIEHYKKEDYAYYMDNKIVAHTICNNISYMEKINMLFKILYNHSLNISTCKIFFKYRFSKIEENNHLFNNIDNIKKKNKTIISNHKNIELKYILDILQKNNYSNLNLKNCIEQCLKNYYTSCSKSIYDDISFKLFDKEYSKEYIHNNTIRKNNKEINNECFNLPFFFSNISNDIKVNNSFLKNINFVNVFDNLQINDHHEEQINDHHEEQDNCYYKNMKNIDHLKKMKHNDDTNMIYKLIHVQKEEQEDMNTNKEQLSSHHKFCDNMLNKLQENDLRKLPKNVIDYILKLYNINMEKDIKIEKLEHILLKYTNGINNYFDYIEYTKNNKMYKIYEENKKMKKYIKDSNNFFIQALIDSHTEIQKVKHSLKTMNILYNKEKMNNHQENKKEDKDKKINVKEHLYNNLNNKNEYLSKIKKKEKKRNEDTYNFNDKIGSSLYLSSRSVSLLSPESSLLSSSISTSHNKKKLFDDEYFIRNKNVNEKKKKKKREDSSDKCNNIIKNIDGYTSEYIPNYTKKRNIIIKYKKNEELKNKNDKINDKINKNINKNINDTLMTRGKNNKSINENIMLNKRNDTIFGKSLLSLNIYNPYNNNYYYNHNSGDFKEYPSSSFLSNISYLRNRKEKKNVEETNQKTEKDKSELYTKNMNQKKTLINNNSKSYKNGVVHKYSFNHNGNEKNVKKDYLYSFYSNPIIASQNTLEKKIKKKILNTSQKNEKKHDHTCDIEKKNYDMIYADKSDTTNGLNIASNQLKNMFNIKKKDIDEKEKRRREQNFKLFFSKIKGEPNRIEEEKKNKVDDKKNKVDEKKNKVDEKKNKVGEKKNKVDETKNKVDEKKNKMDETKNKVDESKNKMDEKKNKMDDKLNDEEIVKKRLNRKGEDKKLTSSCIKEKVNQFEYYNNGDSNMNKSKNHYNILKKNQKFDKNIYTLDERYNPFSNINRIILPNKTTEDKKNGRDSQKDINKYDRMLSNGSIISVTKKKEKDKNNYDTSEVLKKEYVESFKNICVINKDKKDKGIDSNNLLCNRKNQIGEYVTSFNNLNLNKKQTTLSSCQEKKKTSNVLCNSRNNITRDNNIYTINFNSNINKKNNNDDTDNIHNNNMNGMINISTSEHMKDINYKKKFIEDAISSYDDNMIDDRKIKNKINEHIIISPTNNNNTNELSASTKIINKKYIQQQPFDKFNCKKSWNIINENIDNNDQKINKLKHEINITDNKKNALLKKIKRRNNINSNMCGKNKDDNNNKNYDIHKGNNDKGIIKETEHISANQNSKDSYILNIINKNLNRSFSQLDKIKKKMDEHLFM
ncbi:hypothetical protein PGSY75_0924600 [Plasmodium gaboni]|uniref:Uncharacterized protein n=1 Tax=Plasmodium gaboni TaxID=647221 RepID=A0A151LM82_9APIC|nr:hypothetical protein PGSY75_0924600 [Plasmodium gaboni]KYO00227.1 hypothetical protein PGSY75_0924600 [Plasmodium gaboni]